MDQAEIWKFLLGNGLTLFKNGDATRCGNSTHSGEGLGLGVLGPEAMQLFVLSYESIYMSHSGAGLSSRLCHGFCSNIRAYNTFGRTVRDEAHCLGDCQLLLCRYELRGRRLVISTAGSGTAEAHAACPRLATASRHGAGLVYHLPLHADPISIALHFPNSRGPVRQPTSAFK